MAPENEGPNLEEMSDEDFLAQDPASFEGTEGAAGHDDSGGSQDPPAAGDDPAGGADEDDPAAGDDPSNSDDPTNDDPARGDDPAAEDPAGSDKPNGEGDPAGDDPAAGDDPTNDPNEQQPPADGELTVEQFAEIGRQVMGEFKANGKPMKMKSAADVVRLMQMGANYHQKMAGLGPVRKTMKLLEKNGLLEEDKINYLIDLHQKKPEAINQLLRDSKIDPLSINLEDGEGYTPSSRTVDDKELALDDVLDAIKDTPSYNRTLTVIGSEWDQPSREAVSSMPEIVKTINAHMENGIYDQVMRQVEYERTLGNLNGVSDYDAYTRTGQFMHENKLFKGIPATEQTDPAASQKQDSAKSQGPDNDSATRQQEQDRQQRRTAAGPSRRQGSPAGQKQEAINPLGMSDEDYAKQFGADL